MRVAGQGMPMSNLFGAETLTQMGRFYRISVAGDRLAYAQSQYQTDIWTLDVGAPGAGARPLVVSTQVDDAPQFSPDGSRIAFSSARADEAPADLDLRPPAAKSCAQLTSFKSCSAGLLAGRPTARASPSMRARPGSPTSIVDRRHDLESRAGVTSHVVVGRRSELVLGTGLPSTSASDRSGGFQDREERRPPGGPATPLTTHGPGFAAFESPDGRDVYFTRYRAAGALVGSGQRRGGAGTTDPPARWGLLGACPGEGAFVLDMDGPRAPGICLPSLGHRAPRACGGCTGRLPLAGSPGLALSPDERTLLYVGTTCTSDVVMLDGFR